MPRLALSAVLLASGVAAAAQQPAYRVEVRLIEVEARVTDSAGRRVTGLAREDFALEENGVPHDVATVFYVSSRERTLAVPPEARTPDGPSFVTAPAAPTWVYLLTEVAPSEIAQASEAIRRFLLHQLQPGFRVSLGGLPFSEDRQHLLQALDVLAREPFGRGGRPGLADGTRAQQQDAEDERAMASEFRKQEEAFSPIPGFVARPERAENDASFARPYLTESRIDRQLPMYGDIALQRYEELVERLAPLPGKKVVVLFRPGLRIESDNVPGLRRVASLAGRHRVSFYTINSRGLAPVVPVEDRKVPFSIDRRRRMTVDVLGKLDMEDLSREGLETLAVETNGRAVPDSNRLADVFDAVVRDADGYYVVGYHPLDLSENGRYRRIKVRVNRRGVKVDATRGYYEAPSTTPGGDQDKSLALRRALLAELPKDLPVAASAGLFAAGDGSPALVLSAGVPARALQAKLDGDAPRLEALALVRISSDDATRLPLYYERRMSSTAARERWAEIQSDQTAVVAVSDVVPLPPGRHTWRIVFRDEHTGKLGGAEGRISIPKRTDTQATSSLLMTSEVLRRADAEAAADDVLDVGPLRFSPQPLRVFRQGELIHLLFDLYNPSSDDLAASSQGPRLAMLRDGQPLAQVTAHGEAFVDPERRRIRFACAVQTKDLPPGGYTVVLSPPRAGASVQPLRQIFQLLPR